MDQDLPQQPASEESDIKPEGWQNPPSVRDLKQDLNDAKNTHDTQKARIREWLDYLHVEGQAKPKTRKGRSEVQPKLIRKQAEWRYASLSEPFLATDDLFEINPVTWEDAQAAHQNKLVLNNQFNTKIDKQAFIDEYVRTAVDEGTVIVRLGWEFQEKEVEVQVPVVEFRANPMLAPMFQELARMKVENPTGFAQDVPEELKMAFERTVETGTPQEPIITGMETKTELRTIKNCPTVEVCDYRHVVIDPSCKGDLDKANFVIYSFPTSLAQLEAEGRYINLDQINIENNSVLGDPDHDTDQDESDNFNFNDKPRKQFVAYEYWGYWDLSGTGRVEPIVATWVGDVMIRLERNPHPDEKIPFISAQLMPKRNSVYGEPDGELLIDNQKIVGAVTRGMIDVMARSANGQMGFRKDALDATNRRKFQSGQDYEYNGNVDPRLAFHMHTYPEIPVSAQYMLQQQSLEAESMTGVKAFSSGINSDALGDVATGIKGVMDAAGKREAGILRRLAKGLIQIGRRIIAMNAEFLEDEEIIRVTNDSFVTIRRDDLAGNFDLRMDISTAEEDNIKAQELAFMLQTMGPNTDPGITKLIFRDIARLRKMPELAHQIENYEPQPDPLDQQLKQLEIAKLQKEIQLMDSEAAENMAGAQLDLAKAREASSSADLKDLDFVEQESGVKQEREKELHGEQARSNMALETHKANLGAQQTGEGSSTSALDAYLAGRQ